MARESFNSRLGFILVSAGCAIGIGNVWRFPFITGENRRWFLRIILFVVFGSYGTSSADYGAGGRQRQPQKRG